MTRAQLAYRRRFQVLATEAGRTPDERYLTACMALRDNLNGNTAGGVPLRMIAESCYPAIGADAGWLIVTRPGEPGHVTDDPKPPTRVAHIIPLHNTGNEVAA